MKQTHKPFILILQKFDKLESAVKIDMVNDYCLKSSVQKHETLHDMKIKLDVV